MTGDKAMNAVAYVLATARDVAYTAPMDDEGRLLDTVTRRALLAGLRKAIEYYDLQPRHQIKVVCQHCQRVTHAAWLDELF